MNERAIVEMKLAEYKKREDELLALRARVAKLEAALKRLVADYGDVPDPTDTDGQQVFIDARAALKDAPTRNGK